MLQVRAVLQPAINAVVGRAGDANERVRRASLSALLKLCASPALPVAIVGEVVMDAVTWQKKKNGLFTIACALQEV